MDHTVSNLLGIKEEINSKNLDNKKIVKIVAVTKTFEVKKFLHLLNFGHQDFGENKVQEAITKWTEIKESHKDIKLHMIGKLQTNKVKQAVKIFDYIHSVDNVKLAKKISSEQKKLIRILKFLFKLMSVVRAKKAVLSLQRQKNFLMFVERILNFK